MMDIGIAKSLAALRRDRRGNVLPIFAASLIPLLAIVGGGVDASRGYLTKTQLQNACDAGVLAGRRAMAQTNVFEDAEKVKARRMFDANFEKAIVDAKNVTFETRAGDEGEVFGTATATIPTVLMKLFGTHELSFSVACMAEFQIANTDIMFVLDTTGSMGGWRDRIQDLRDAVRDFHETLALSVADEDVRVRYGFVPYSSTVNASVLLEDPDDLLPAGDLSDDDFRDITLYQTRVAVLDQDKDYVVSKKDVSTDYVEWWRCYGPSKETSGTKPGDVTITYFEERRGSCRATKYLYEYDENHMAHHFHWEYRQAALDTSEFKTFDAVSIATDLDLELAYLDEIPEKSEFTMQELANLPIRDKETDGYKWMTISSSKWNGCLQERNTVPTDDFDPVPEDAYDLDIDRIPNSVETRWSPIWPAVSYGYDADDDEGFKTSTACPAPMLPFRNIELSGDNTEVPGWLDTYLDNLNPVGSTYHDIGMIWGARLGSAEGVFAGNVTDGDLDDIERHLIFMTDGQMDPSICVFTAYGVEFVDNRIAPAEADDCYDSDATVAARHTQRFLAACDAARAEGYIIWVIGFGATPTAEMEECATGEALSPDDTKDLSDAFRFIASQIADLRLGE